MIRTDIIQLQPITKKEIKKYLKIHKEVLRYYGIRSKGAMHKGVLK